MDEDSTTSTKPSDFMCTDTVGVTVGNDRDGSNTDGGSVKRFPAILVPGVHQIPHAVKHIYRKLSSVATEVDQGVPDLVLSLISTDNVFSFQTSEKFGEGLSKIVNNCGLWLVTNGMGTDPMAQVVSRTLHSTMPQSESNEEVLSIVINSTEVLHHRDSNQLGHNHSMTDFQYNTLYFLLNKQGASQEQLCQFRALSAVKLGSPPPALLIGVPDERSMNSTGHTPMTNVTAAPTLLLSSSSPAYDKHPMSVCIFAGATLKSLIELKIYIDFGIPVVVVHDVSELCALLKKSSIATHRPNFEHESFQVWLDGELRSIALATTGSYNEEEIAKATTNISRILSASIGEYPLLNFTSLEFANELPETILNALVQTAMDTGDIRRIIRLAVKLNVSSVIRHFKLDTTLDEESISDYLIEALLSKNRIEVLAALLDQNIPIRISPNMLMKILDRRQDEHFFETVILGHCLGYDHRPQDFDEHLASDIDDLLYYLSGGFSSLFKPEWILSSSPKDHHEDSIQILTFLALLINETELVKCLWSYSKDPLPLALILARISRSLAYEAQEWFYYEEKLLELSHFMKSMSVTLFDRIYDECQLKAYDELCYSLESFNHLTLSQLAFETNNRPFIAHECCQKWLHFLLYKDIQFRSTIRLPNWLQIILAALLVFPIKSWFSIRHSKFSILKHKHRLAPSPTLALLENEKNHRNHRPSSMYSVHSMKSGGYLRDELGSTVDERIVLPPNMTGGSATPSAQSSLMQQFVIDDVDMTPLTNFPQNANSKFRRTTISSSNQQRPLEANTQHMKRKRHSIELARFYSAPIVKYWISLVFRLMYLLAFSYSVLLPGCGNFVVDLFIWIWSLMWWLESLWVLKSRTVHTSWKQMRWTTFDVILVAVLLLVLFLLKFGIIFNAKLVSFVGAYSIKVLWAIFLVYQCYATLFIYVPLSPVLGPLLVRVRLMLLRDFTNSLVLVFLSVCSGAIAIKAILYPDLEASSKVITDSLSWAWLSLFTIDLSVLRESSECSAASLVQNSQQCAKINGYTNPSCPAQSWIAYFSVIEYLIVIKLICWPLLFALFARTAKNVDQEADRIWKYQLYALGTDFSYRPFLPPPFTFLFFFGVCCCQLTGCISGVLYRMTTTRIDHPDVHHHSSPSRKTSNRSYRALWNMSRELPTYWNRLAVSIWKDKCLKTDEKNRADPHLREAMNTMVSSINMNFCGKAIGFKPASDHKIRRLKIDSEFQSWTVIAPNYYPPYFTKPTNEFPNDIQRCIDDDSENGRAEIRKHWQQKALSDRFTKDQKRLPALSSAGLPLNPSGRTGLAGRGDYPKFGPNFYSIYVIFAKFPNGVMILVNAKNEIPSKFRHESGRSDEFLGELLSLLGVPDMDVQIMSSRSHLVPGQLEGRVAHVCAEPVISENDTDNAWQEDGIWAYNLTELVTQQFPSSEYKWRSASGEWKSQRIKSFVTKALGMFSL